jgi:hypothetical protein
MIHPFIDSDLGNLEQGIEGIRSSNLGDRIAIASGITRELMNIKNRIDRKDDQIDSVIRKISQNVTHAGSATGDSIDAYCDLALDAVQELYRLLR